MQQRKTTPDANQGSHFVTERPPPGLARGAHAWPAWAVVALCVSVLVIAVGYLGYQRRRDLPRRKKP